MVKRQPPNMTQIEKDEKRRLPEVRQVLSDEEIKRQLRLNETQNHSVYAIPILQLLSKHDWLPARLMGEALGSENQFSSIHKQMTYLSKKGLLECRRAFYHRLNNAVWVRITAEGRKHLKDAEK